MVNKKTIGIIVHPGWSNTASYMDYEKFIYGMDDVIVFVPRVADYVRTLIIDSNIEHLLRYFNGTDEVFKGKYFRNEILKSYRDMIIKQLSTVTKIKHKKLGVITYTNRKVFNKKHILYIFNNVHIPMSRLLDGDFSFISEVNKLCDDFKNDKNVTTYELGTIELVTIAINEIIESGGYDKDVNIKVCGEYYNQCVTMLHTALQHHEYTNITLVKEFSVLNKKMDISMYDVNDFIKVGK